MFEGRVFVLVCQLQCKLHTLFCQWDVLDTQYYKDFRTLSRWTRSSLAPFSFRISVSLSLSSSFLFLCTLPFSFRFSVAPSVSRLLSCALLHSLEHPLSPSLVFVRALVLALALFRYCAPWRSLTVSLACRSSRENWSHGDRDSSFPSSESRR